MSTKSNRRQRAGLLRPVYLVALALMFFHVDIYAMYGNIGDLRGALGRRAAGQGIKPNQSSSSPRAATLSPDVISRFNQAVKSFDVNAVEQLVNAYPGLLTDAKVSAIKSAVQAPSNDRSRGQHLALLKFLLGQAADPNGIDTPFAMNALDVVAGKIKSSQDSQDEEAADFYQTIARELVAKGATLKKRQDHQFIIDQLDARSSTPDVIAQQEPAIVTPSVPQSSDASVGLPPKLIHRTKNRPFRKKVHPNVRAKKSSEPRVLSAEVDVVGSSLVQEPEPVALPSDAIVPSENLLPSREAIVKEEVVPSVSDPIDFAIQEPFTAPLAAPVSSVQPEVSLPPVVDSISLPPVAEFESIPSDFGSPSMATFDEESQSSASEAVSLPPVPDAVVLPPMAEFESTANVAEPVDFATQMPMPLEKPAMSLGESEKRAQDDASRGVALSKEPSRRNYTMADLRNAVRNLDYAQSIEILEKSSLLFEREAEALKVLLKLVTPKDEASTARLLDIFQYALAQEDIDVNLRPVFQDRPETALDVAFDRLEKHLAEGDSYAVSFFEKAIQLLDAQGATLMRLASDPRAQQVLQELRSRPASSPQELEEIFQEGEKIQLRQFKDYKSQVAERAELQKIREGLARDLRSLSNDLMQEREALDLLERKQQELISVHQNTQKEIQSTRQLIENLRTNVRTNE